MPADPQGSSSQWTWAESHGTSAPWKPLGESETKLLDHAYRESWGRLELDIEGKPYVIDPFFLDAEAHFAAPLHSDAEPGIFIARAFGSAAQQLFAAPHAQEPSSSSSSSSCSAAAAESRCPQTAAASQPAVRRRSSFCWNAASCCSSADRQQRLRSQPHETTDAEGFQLVLPRRHRGRRESHGASTADCGAPRDSVARWRAFPKVDLAACDDYHLVRQVLIDGVDTALQHGGRRRLSPAGIGIAVAHFAELSFPVRVVVPHWLALCHREHSDLFTESPESLLEAPEKEQVVLFEGLKKTNVSQAYFKIGIFLLQALKKDDLLIVLPDTGKASWYPSRSRLKNALDAEYTVELCKTFNAVYCSNDFNQFLHLLDGSASGYNDYLYMAARSCLFAFDGDDFYHILDSLGRGKFVDTLFLRNKTN
ncbi:hypothetical protein, conserved [Eimeria tenella]|uniref:WWE domain-containing protein n=1 Tax=Eimeria tenella TaxID=5802 RepID=U6L3S3_EIMTE|nr:hypothetical protein, conserved [Eimeria tenella]CDJ45032.1 hypothetical protein, conserved [Eimeria tenella]|eukprot:XP_013235779.1 hypothetical protein, conserved [Eimeria tenella]